MIRKLKRIYYLIFRKDELLALAILRYGKIEITNEWISNLPDNLIIRIYNAYTTGIGGGLTHPDEMKLFFNMILVIFERIPELIERKKAYLKRIIQNELILAELEE